MWAECKIISRVMGDKEDSSTHAFSLLVHYFTTPFTTENITNFQIAFYETFFLYVWTLICVDGNDNEARRKKGFMKKNY